MSNSPTGNAPFPHATAHRRGGAYVAVLATMSLVMLLGIGGLTLNRLAAETAGLTHDAIQARLLARSALDLALHHIDQNPASWRADFAADAVLQDEAFGRGTFTVTAADPADGDLLDDNTQDVTLRAEAHFGDARRLLQVTVDGDGVPIVGTWSAPSD